MLNPLSPSIPRQRCADLLFGAIFFLPVAWLFFAPRFGRARECVVTRWFKAAAVAGMLGFGAMSLLNAAAHAEPGVFDDRIVFGQSAAFDGPAAALGLGMREGILAAFNEANAAGGVSGRKLELVSYDDSYEPERRSPTPSA